MLEAGCHKDNTFWTGTFNEENIDPNGNLNPKDLKNFLLRIRRKLNGYSFRYFAVGEYGELSWRPHYHIIFFGLGNLHHGQIFRAWNYKKDGLGIQQFDEVNKQTASYIAGYTIKKLTNPKDERLNGKHPEFMRTSRKDGGIGLPAIKKIAKDLMKNPNWKPQILSELKHGKVSWPLGRYLTEKMANEQGITEGEWDKRLYCYQQQIFDETMEKGGWYYDALIELKKQKRRQQQWKHDNLKKDRKI